MAVIINNDQYQIVEVVVDGKTSLSLVFKPGSFGANQETLIGKANAALAANATYLAIATPSTAQNTAQTKLLTREMDAVIRVLMADFTSVSDT